MILSETESLGDAALRSDMMCLLFLKETSIHRRRLNWKGKVVGAVSSVRRLMAALHGSVDQAGGDRGSNK